MEAAPRGEGGAVWSEYPMQQHRLSDRTVRAWGWALASALALGVTAQAGAVLRVGFGAAWVEIAALADSGAPGAQGGLVEVILSSTAADLPPEGRLLDTTTTHGAPIRLCRPVDQ